MLHSIAALEAMSLRVLVLLLSIAVGFTAAHELPPGIKAGLYGDIVGHSDFQMNLRPPEENTHDTEKALDAILTLEESKAKEAESNAAAVKQRMLNIEKVKIRDIVRTAFAPLLARVKAS